MFTVTVSNFFWAPKRMREEKVGEWKSLKKSYKKSKSFFLLFNSICDVCATKNDEEEEWGVNTKLLHRGKNEDEISNLESE